MVRGILMLAVAGFLSSCASPQIVSETPSGIEISCATGLTCSSSPQELADLAQEHCQKFGQNAQKRSSYLKRDGQAVGHVQVCSRLRYAEWAGVPYFVAGILPASL